MYKRQGNRRLAAIFDSYEDEWVSKTGKVSKRVPSLFRMKELYSCLLYTSDAADERSSVDLGGRRIIKKKKSI